MPPHAFGVYRNATPLAGKAHLNTMKRDFLQSAGRARVGVLPASIQK
jgi:hypothetical protein